MGEQTAKELFVFFHIPKTGGISINHLLAAGFPLGTSFINLGRMGKKDRMEYSSVPLPERPEAERNVVRAISGHDVNIRTEQLVPGRVARRITFLRKPASRIVSAFNYETSDAATFVNWDESTSFETWYRHQERDTMTKFLAKRVIPSSLGVTLAQGHRFLGYPLRWSAASWVFNWVQQALSNFWFVGCTESLSTDMPKIAARMGIPGQIGTKNATGRNFSRRLRLTEELESRLAAENPADTRLYEYWQARSQQRLAEIEREPVATA